MTSRNAAGTVATILASLCLATVNSLAAQDAGDRVRVTIGGNILTGDVFETSDAGFTLVLSEEELIEVSDAEVEKLEVRTCCVDNAWLWMALIGGGAGGLLGALWDFMSGNYTCSDASFLWWEDDSCEIHGNGIEWGVLGGGVVGFVVGKTALKDKWEIIPPGRRDPTLGPLVDIGSRPNGNPAMILGARIRF